MTFTMKRRIFLLWYTLCAFWTLVPGVHLGEDRQSLRLRSSRTKPRIHKQRHSFNSKSRKGSPNLAFQWRGHKVSFSNIKNAKRAFIQRRIQLKGSPKGVIVNVNGQKIYSTAGDAAVPQPNQGFIGPNKAINLRINLNKKPYESSRPQRKQQPIIISPPRPQQPMRPILITVPRPQPPVVLPAPAPPPVLPGPPPQPGPLPQPGLFPQPATLPPIFLPPLPPQPAPAPVKEENELGNILQTVALLKTLGKKEEPPKVVTVPVPVPVQAYPAGYQRPGQNYPAGTSPNQGYPAGGNQNQGYPAGGSENQGYPAGGSENQGYPAGGGPGSESPQGYPAGTPLGAPPAAGNGRTPGTGNTGTGGTTNPLAALSGLVPFLIGMNCRCGCERRCPDLCGLCKGVDEEIYDSIECCKTEPCPCSNAGTFGGTTQPVQQGTGVPAQQGTAVAVPQQGTGLLVPQNPQASTQPVAVPNPAQVQPAPALPALPVPAQPAPLSYPQVPVSTQINPAAPAKPASAPPQTPAAAPQLPPVSAPPPLPGTAPAVPPLPQLPPLQPGSPVPQSPPTASVTAPGQLPPIPPKPEITPPVPGGTPPKPPMPEVAPLKPEVTPPKPEVPLPALPGSEPGSPVPPKPEITPPKTNPKEGSLPSNPPRAEGPVGPGEALPPPPENEGGIKIPPVSVLPGENSPAPSLPSLPLPKPAYLAPPPAPQVFIIKENNESPKDQEDSKSAEALDNLSKTFEDAFTEAYKSEKRKGRHGLNPRNGRLRQRLGEQEIFDKDSEEPPRKGFRHRLHDQDDSSLDLEQEVIKDFEKEEGEERMQSSVGSRREFTEQNLIDNSDNDEDSYNENDKEVSENADDSDDTNGYDGHDLDNNHDNDDEDDHDNHDQPDHDGHNNDDDHKSMDINLETEPSSDADEPRQSHSHSEEDYADYRQRETKRHRLRKKKKYLHYHYHRGNHPDEDSILQDRHSLEKLRSKHQKVRTYSSWEHHKAGELPQKHFHAKHHKKKSTKTILPSSKYHQAKKRKVNSLKHRLKSHYYLNRNSVRVSYDENNFADSQERDSGRSHRHHARHPVQYHKQFNSRQHGHQDEKKYKPRGTQYKSRNYHNQQYKNSHANSGSVIPEEEISESSSFEEGSANRDYESFAVSKLEDPNSASDYAERDHHIPAKKSDANKGLKTLLSTVQSLKPTARHKLRKDTNLKKEAKIDVHSFSSGEESGQNEVSSFEGSNYYY